MRRNRDLTKTAGAIPLKFTTMKQYGDDIPAQIAKFESELSEAESKLENDFTNQNLIQRVSAINIKLIALRDRASGFKKYESLSASPYHIEK